MKKAGFIDATDAFHDALKNTMDIFFAKNSVGQIIAKIDIPLFVNPVMILVMDGAKKAVSMKLNWELSQAENGAPLLLRNKSAIELFDAIGIEVVGAVAGGVVVKAGSKAFKVVRSFFGKHKFKFNKKINSNPAPRLPRTNGKWKGEPGNGEWYSDKAEVLAITKGKPVVFKNGRPDFTLWEKGRMKFPRGKLDGSKDDFKLVYKQLAEAKGLKNPTVAKDYLKNSGLTPHHLDDRTIQFIETDLHGNIPHVGSASDMRGGF